MCSEIPVLSCQMSEFQRIYIPEPIFLTHKIFYKISMNFLLYFCLRVRSGVSNMVCLVLTLASALEVCCTNSHNLLDQIDVKEPSV